MSTFGSSSKNEGFPQKMRTPLVYDGRNVYAKADMEKSDINDVIYRQIREYLEIA